MAPLARAYAAIAALVLLIDAVNVLSQLYDAGRSGRVLPAVLPLTWEFTSGAAMIAVCGIIYLALRYAPPGRAPWLRVAWVHVLALFAFSGLHTGLMTLIRMGLYASRGYRYGVPPWGDWVYEFRKDAMSYLVLAALFWLFARPGARPPPAAEVARAAPADTFDILDGPNVWRTPLDQILAVRAAGNYVEFLLQDGRRPLMRASLAEIETSLGGCGFVRTHRSWLVNPARLCRLEAVGSGDYRLVLAGGAEASLSRRFPGALERLRAGSS